MKTAATSLLAAFMLAVLTGLAAPAQAREVEPAVEAEFHRIIETQIDAFRRGDGETAFAQASPTIRALFGTAERFMAMVETDYAAVFRPRDYEFEPALAWRDHTAQPVRFIGPDGRGVLGIYFMERQADGSWRIGGVELLPLHEREI